MPLPVSTRLRVVSATLSKECAAIAKAAGGMLEHARRAGECLNEAKELVEHGEWEAWLLDNFAGSQKTAAAYMRIASRWDELESNLTSRSDLEDLSIAGAVKLLAKPRPEPVPETPTEESSSIACPNCGSTTVDEDGDCAECREPAVAAQVEDDASEDDVPEDDAHDVVPFPPPDGLSFRVLSVVETWCDEHPETTGHVAAIILRGVANQIDDG